MPFVYHRTIRFQDTDSAGVVYFANTLAMCHEAYEESLMASGIQVQKFLAIARSPFLLFVPPSITFALHFAAIVMKYRSAQLSSQKINLKSTM